MLGSKSAKSRMGEALLFGFLGGCFAVLASAIVGCVFWLTGLLSPGPLSTVLYVLLAAFGVSSATFFLAILAFEDFLEP